MTEILPSNQHNGSHLWADGFCVRCLRAEVAHQTDMACQASVANTALRSEVERLTDVLNRNGFRRCDIPACNCGSWHHIGGFAERFREIDEATADDERNGETLLSRVRRIVLDRERLRAALEESERNERHTSGVLAAMERDYKTRLADVAPVQSGCQCDSPDVHECRHSADDPCPCDCHAIETPAAPEEK